MSFVRICRVGSEADADNVGYVARAKAELHKASRGIKSQLPGEIKATLQDGGNDDETHSGTRHREDGL
jgi:hypothetical protein